MKYELVVLLLWAIGFAVTLYALPHDRITFVAPVFAVCMIGSVVTVRRARIR